MTNLIKICLQPVFLSCKIVFLLLFLHIIIWMTFLCLALEKKIYMALNSIPCMGKNKVGQKKKEPKSDLH